MKHVILQGDVLHGLKTLDDGSINCGITSPPYWALRDYGVDGQLGLEPTLQDFIENMLQVTGELHRVLRDDGLLFWNHGDNYGGSWKGGGDKHQLKKGSPATGLKGVGIDKCLMLQNYQLVMAMIQEQGWLLRNVIIWHKPNPMPESVKDRLTKTYEPVFMLSKSKRYHFDLDAIRVPTRVKGYRPFNRRIRDAAAGRVASHQYKATDQEIEDYELQKVQKGWGGKNPGDLWSIATKGFPDAHFATFPEELIRPMIAAGCPEGGTVLDPFLGSGTTMQVAEELHRDSIGIEINLEYVALAEGRLRKRIGQVDLSGNKTTLEIRYI